jgi:precorrin-2/cobalt-factor-2 C20-methyltransferase
VLRAGQDAAFVTLGDPLTYSTFSYLLRTIKKLVPDVKVAVIPGITAYQAAAAASTTPLVEGEESLHLISGVEGGDKLRTVIEASENVVMLKTYRNFSDIYAALEELDLLDKAVYVGRCGLEGEAVVEDLRSLKGEHPPYLSLIIIKKKGISPGSLSLIEPRASRDRQARVGTNRIAPARLKSVSASPAAIAAKTTE